ncbi:MAG: hypothetical protein V1914_02405 [archaeon]
MPTLTLAIPADLKQEMEALPEFNWSHICRERIREKIAEYKLFKSITDKSKLTEKDALEIADKINKGLYKAHKKKAEELV